jgi:uncharacterized protein YqeY
MIADLVNEALAKSMKQADEMLVKHRNFLRLVKGELQMAEVRQNKPLTDEQQAGVLKKILKGNEETLAVLPADDARCDSLTEENKLLNSFLPKVASNEEIKAALAGVVEQIKAAKNDGQATGIAMKTLKEAKIGCEGNIVKDIVSELRK